MPLLTIVVTLLVVGVLLALVNRYGPPYVDGTILRLINIVVVVVLVLWLLSLFGILDMARTIRVG